MERTLQKRLAMYAGIFFAVLIVVSITFTHHAVSQTHSQPQVTNPAVESKRKSTTVPDRPGRAFPSCEKCRESGCEKMSGNACFMTPSGCTCVMSPLK